MTDESVRRNGGIIMTV